MPSPIRVMSVSLPEGPSSARSDAPGSTKLRRQLGRLRVLVVVSLVLVIVLGVWSVVGIVSLTSQVSSLESKVDSLTARLGSQPAEGSTSAGMQSETSASASPRADATVPADLSVPAGTDKAGAVIVGDPEAAKVVEVYVDYQCPYCQRWETELGAALMERALQPGSGMSVRQYNMAFLGEANRSLDPPAASARAANAAACVLDGTGVRAFVDFNSAIFAAPGGEDPASRFDTASLVALASSVGADEDAVACIEEERFVPFVAATTQAAFARGVTGTPTVLVNGKPLEDSFSDPQLLAMLRM
jgi:protein-disulfide isomerase